MRFGMVGRVGPGMKQVVGFGIGSREKVILGANAGRPVVTNGKFSASRPFPNHFGISYYYYYIGHTAA